MNWNKSKVAEFNCREFVPNSIWRGPSMSRRENIKEKGFVLEIGGRAVLAFRAGNLEHAKELCTEDWFVEELTSYRSCGHPIWDGTAELRIRRADASETAEIQIALTTELARKEYDGHVFVFFVPVDADLQ
jgi:hypothetical protein